MVNPVDHSPPALTFGFGHSKSESQGSLTASPVFKKAQGYSHKRSSSLFPPAALDSGSLPILPEVRRSLGLTGTMGGSAGSIAKQDYGGSDPDSDIPDELEVILSNLDQEGEDTISFDRQLAHPPLPSPGLPPEMPLPVLEDPPPKSSLAGIPFFRATLVDEDEHHADVEEAGTLSEDDTKRSFDFAGEWQRLNKSGASDRHSFIEQLKNAFRTPAKVARASSFNLLINYVSKELSPQGFPIDVKAQPTLLPGSDSCATTAPDKEVLDIVAPKVLQNAMSVTSTVRGRAQPRLQVWRKAFIIKHEENLTPHTLRYHSTP